MINHQTIIDWKLSNINKDVTNELVLTNEMQHYIEAHPELEKELAFIDAFWQNDNQEQPSSELDKRFYKMLQQAQTAQQEISNNHIIEKKLNAGLLKKLKDIFTVSPVKPFAQVAVLSLVFVLGFNANDKPVDNSTADSGLSNLQQEVSSLSTMLALSMLEKSSAAERLTGVAYSQETDLTNPILMKTLMSTLENDRSTAVKLAIINTFGNLPDISGQESKLIALTLKEQNTLVKIELCSLLFNVGTPQTKSRLLTQLKESELTPDMAEFLKKINAISHI